MFWHNFKYTFLTLIKNKMLIFWTFAFPIILGIFFNMAFSNIENSEKLQVFDIAIIETDEFKNNNYLKEAFKSLSSDDETKLFNILYINLDEANKLLENKDITGYIYFRDTAKIVVNQSDINETILKTVVDEVLEQELIMKNLMAINIEKEIKNNPEVLNNINELKIKVYNDVLNLININEDNIKDISKNNMSYTMIEYYSLIAMACLYGGIIGMWAINKCLANMGNVGKRISVAPTKKSIIIFSSALSGYIIELIGLLLLFLFTIFVIKVDYGANLPLVIILAIIGSFTGLSLGIMLASALKSSEDLKIGLIISITMLGCFLSGMMGITMKYIVDTNMPIINKINPASLITDSFYSLYYYNTYTRYIENIISLIIISIIFISISIYSLRRTSYDHF